MWGLVRAVVILAIVSACSQQTTPARKVDAAAAPAPGYENALPPYLRSKLSEPFKGDLDAMVKRRFIRVAAPYSRTFYYLDSGIQRGLSYEYMKLYEDKLNQSLGKDRPRVFVIIVPVSRDRLLRVQRLQPRPRAGGVLHESHPDELGGRHRRLGRAAA